MTERHCRGSQKVAGTAAAQAIGDGRAVQDLDYGKPRQRLVADGMVLGR